MAPDGAEGNGPPRARRALPWVRRHPHAPPPPGPAGSGPEGPPSRRFGSSLDVDWSGPSRQTYREAGVGFDVDRAKAYLSTHALPVEYVSAEALASWMQVGPSGRPGRYAGKVDGGRIAEADPSIPLVFVETPVGGYLIDGHHRLERGRALQLREFPVVVLRDPVAVRALMHGLTSRPLTWWVWRRRWGGRPRSEAARVPPRAGSEADERT